jgi:protein-S-isoprenylcysteine O-methyltransferase Ste14
MDTARRVLAMLLIVSLPPAVIHWLIVHPWVRFWRRVGPRATYGALVALLAGSGAAVFAWHERLLGYDLGTREPLLALGLVLYAASAWLSWLTRRQLDFRTFTGIPEVVAARPGRLLTEGIYARIRHPRYAAVILGVTGCALIANFLGVYLIVLASLLLFVPVIILEERELAARFGPAYVTYRRRVPALFPGRRA